MSVINYVPSGTRTLNRIAQAATTGGKSSSSSVLLFTCLHLLQKILFCLRGGNMELYVKHQSRCVTIDRSSLNVKAVIRSNKPTENHQLTLLPSALWSFMVSFSSLFISPAHKFTVLLHSHSLLSKGHFQPQQTATLYTTLPAQQQTADTSW